QYLALIDTFAGKSAAITSMLKSFVRLSQSEKVTYLARKIRKKIRRTVAGVALPAPVKAVRQACAAAERRYRPQVFDGKIWLFLPSSKSLRNSRDQDGGWGDFAANG